MKIIYNINTRIIPSKHIVFDIETRKDEGEIYVCGQIRYDYNFGQYIFFPHEGFKFLDKTVKMISDKLQELNSDFQIAT